MWITGATLEEGGSTSDQGRCNGGSRDVVLVGGGDSGESSSGGGGSSVGVRGTVLLLGIPSNFRHVLGIVDRLLGAEAGYNAGAGFGHAGGVIRGATVVGVTSIVKSENMLLPTSIRHLSRHVTVGLEG